MNNSLQYESQADLCIISTRSPTEHDHTVVCVCVYAESRASAFTIWVCYDLLFVKKKKT